jgi:hypothetical protein
MSIRHFVITAFLFFISSVCISQKSTVGKRLKLSEIIQINSYYWQLDSLAGNGYRLCCCSEFVKSEQDSISTDYLVKYLGKPNHTQEDFKWYIYRYFAFDYKEVAPKMKQRLFYGIVSLDFYFDINNNKFLGVKENWLHY